MPMGMEEESPLFIKKDEVWKMMKEFLKPHLTVIMDGFGEIEQIKL